MHKNSAMTTTCSKTTLVRALVFLALIIMPVYQQIYWWTHGCVNGSNFLLSILWFLVCVFFCVLSASFIPEIHKAKRHKILIKFRNSEREYIRMCTRTYWSAIKFCIKEMYRKHSVPVSVDILD